MVYKCTYCHFMLPIGTICHFMLPIETMEATADVDFKRGYDPRTATLFFQFTANLWVK
jgi:hypothetical protein